MHGWSNHLFLGESTVFDRHDFRITGSGTQLVNPGLIDGEPVPRNPNIAHSATHCYDPSQPTLIKRNAGHFVWYTFLNIPCAAPSNRFFLVSDNCLQRFPRRGPIHQEEDCAEAQTKPITSRVARGNLTPRPSQNRT